MEPSSPSGFRDPKIAFKGFIYHVCILDLAYYYYFVRFCDIGCSKYRLSSWIRTPEGEKAIIAKRKHGRGDWRHGELSLNSDTLNSSGEIVQKVWSIGIIICWNADV
jgi:hypothetical protein